MDPEDLLDQEVEELPGLEGHATANMDVLKALDTLDVSYRYVIRHFLIQFAVEVAPTAENPPSRSCCAVDWMSMIENDILPRHHNYLN
jgi:hypothetical protein